MNTLTNTFNNQNQAQAAILSGEVVGSEKGRKRKYKFLKLRLLACVICLSILDIRLAGSHAVKTFHLFRRYSEAYPVFIFGVVFWGFILALPLAAFPVRKIAFRHRFIIAAFSVMIFMDLLYLFAFAAYAFFVKR